MIVLRVNTTSCAGLANKQWRHGCAALGHDGTDVVFPALTLPILYAGRWEGGMLATWNQAWKATAIPILFLGSAALGQTKGAWVDPPAYLSVRPAQASELSSPSQVQPSPTVSSSSPAVTAPADAETMSSLTAAQPKSEGRTKRTSSTHWGQQSRTDLIRTAPRLQNSQSPPEPAAAPTSASNVAGQPNFVRGRSSSRQQDAQNLAVNYLNLWSASNRQTLQSTPEFYGSTVLFHGQRMSFEALLAEKPASLDGGPTETTATALTP